MKLFKHFPLLAASLLTFNLSDAMCCQAQQVISDDKGGVFMEEDLSSGKKAPPRQPSSVDVGNTGTSFDSKGKIVPLLNGNGEPMMQSSGTTLEVSKTPAMMYTPTYYLNPFGQKVDAYGNPLPAGRYLPYTPYAVSPGYGATFNSNNGAAPYTYQGGGTVFGGAAAGGRFGSGGTGGFLAVPRTTEFNYGGTVQPIFPAGQ